MPKKTDSFNDILEATEAEAPKLRRRRNWLTFDRVFFSFACSFSIGFLVFAYCVSLIDPEYFNRRVLATMKPSGVDTMNTGTVEKTMEGVGAPMPAPRLVRSKPLVPADYQIITVFDREAILATQDELLRVKIGSVAPGLGEILSIDQRDGGLVIGTAEATLRSSEN